MLDTTLVEALESLTPAEQKAILAVAEYLTKRRVQGTAEDGDALIAELAASTPVFSTPDETISPARAAARKFMRENATLMSLLAQ